MQAHDVGSLMIRSLSCLVKDAHASLGADIFHEFQSIVASGDIQAIRSYVFPDVLNANAYILKWTYQLKDYLKRFRFSDDVFTQEELEIATNGKFISTQLRLPACRPSTISCNMVLRTARKIVKDVLKEYDPSVHIEHCRFGSKAANGVSQAKGYLDLRLGHLSGSVEHLEWFKNHVLPNDPLLRAAVRECGKKNRISYAKCSSLDLFNVPKSWKSLRGIMPNTVVGNYYTNGLGDYIASRLSDYGIRLSRMQDLHKKLAKKASQDRKHVTADLSSASDSFTSWLVNALVPRAWYRALKLGRITDCKIGEDSVKLVSFMTMGIGFTFPLQSLLFYALIKSIGTLLDCQGTYSVYGDDLIYPRRIHKYVRETFEALGFLLNKEKTFVESNFRESCGGDYFRGVDVRPYSYQGESQRVGRQRYAAIVYRIANGIRRRWSEHEVPSLLFFLQREIIATDFTVLQIPPSYPDYAGWKTEVPRHGVYWSPVTWINSTLINSTWTSLYSANFFYLREVPTKRFVLFQRGYLWEALRPTSKQKMEGPRTYSLKEWAIWANSILREELAESVKEAQYGSSRQRLIWVKQRPSKGRVSNQAFRLRATVAEVQSNQLVKQTGQTSTWSKESDTLIK